jgi:enamine deaminase RidA (YjgF/YER057c/UK114 family)
MAGEAEHNLEALGLLLPSAAAPAANYVPAVLAGGMLYISGQLPMRDGVVAYKGHLGADVSLEDGKAAAQLCALNILAQAKAMLGDLDRVTRVVRLGGFVAATPDYTDHPQVVNGASDLMVAVLGAKGQHARAAVGVASLPRGAAVEVEAVFAVD